MPQDFSVGNKVFLMNPRAWRHKVAVGSVSGLYGSHKFHGAEIPSSWLKVDIHEALLPEVALMFPSAAVDMPLIEHATESPTIWDQKYVKHANGA